MKRGVLMFKNAGPKIKVLAKLNTFIWIIAGVMVGSPFKDDAILIIAIVLGVLIGWFTSIFLYAFGELCENVYILANGVDESSEDEPYVEPAYASTPNIESKPNTFGGLSSWRCPKCGTTNLGREDVCLNCAYDRRSTDKNDTTWKCPECGTMNSVEDEFCYNCFYVNEKIHSGIWKCPSCGKENKDTAKFCAKCGNLK